MNLSKVFAGRRRPAAIGVALLAVGATAVALTTMGVANAGEQPSTDLYLVQVAGDPVATYAGGESGYAATKPAEGEKVDANSSAAKAYRGHLKAKHGEELDRAQIARGKSVADYGVTFNGFAARLTAAEATRLAHTKGVARVWKNEIFTVDTTTTPGFLGLSGTGGVWNKQFGGVNNAGNGVIIGDIDTGLWSESASFAALSEPRPDAATIAGKWAGTCDAGVSGAPFTCNNKVIGGRYYNMAGLARPYEFLSPRDFNGHGTHTASTAAGDNNVAAAVGAIPVGNVSGMAPAARIAVYKALWHNAATGSASGSTVDLVAAIDDAVADGVDVINYSISGSQDYVVDAAEIAFFNAAAAGVFVAASAGNSGPGASTVAHNSPWETTVAASSHDRSVAKSVTLGNGAVYNGIGVGPAVGPAALIDSAAAAAAGAPAAAAALCFSDWDAATPGVQPALDASKIAGKIVLCRRGTNARVDKSLAVANGGGIGMILYNGAAGQSQDADFHNVPSIHINNVDGAAVKAYAATATPTATISAVLPVAVRAPEMAGFSSAGPAIAGGGDLLKPDITAPGVSVIAAVAPPANSGHNYDAYSGTSMSSPHIAGIAALIRSAHPDWSPMTVKSAMMTTASQLDNTGQPIQRAGSNATPLDFGSGHVTPGSAFDPGLVYNSGPVEWIQYGCAIGQFQLITSPSFCGSFPSVAASDLNYPTMASGSMAGVQVFHRTVTNVAKEDGTYRPTISAPAGFTVTVSPSKLEVHKGESKSYTVTVTRTTAALGDYAFGSVTWNESEKVHGQPRHSVRSNIAVRPVAIAAPVEVAGSGATGSTTISVKAGFAGTLNASINGLTAATVTPSALDKTGPSFNANAPAASIRTAMIPVTIPAGTAQARFATFDADYAAGTDVDIYVYQGSTLVGVSAGGSAEESITLDAPAAGAYSFYVDLFDVVGTTLTVNANHFVVPTGAAGNATVSPATQAVATGGSAGITVNWTGLTAGTRYFGNVVLNDGTSDIASTYVMVTA